MNPQQQHRRAVGGLGYTGGQAGIPGVMEQIAQGVMPTPGGGLSVNPTLLEGAPAWAAAILNMQQHLLAEVEILKYALFRRSILTEPEMMEARMMVTQQMDAAFKQTIGVIEREVAQRVSPPQDPRRSPGAPQV